ncbi:PH domain-containing protein [Kitasatospora atroaurantiaca]|uniref:PH (Pleckstrin Homology) domain-containing protein n=1 Tax=Kitasatospora atroaurantiaca TaxID=285545 RepID=A0A561EZU7_9ACTN|nr:PH domain-containing protein [Kitasatospora atroaurantiaca]TWE21135.1 PH (Pleckstrin Homology) domain-containing protein [Kitasatospora atroaurantiaca]
MSTSVELPVTWAPRRNRVVLLPLCVLLVTMFTVIAFALPPNWHLNDRAALVVSGLLFAGVGLMLVRPRVSADDEGVTVVNFVRSRRLAWAEIVRVNFRQGDPWVTLDLADGTALAAVGIQPAGGHEQAIRAARALRDLVEQRSTARR